MTLIDTLEALVNRAPGAQPEDIAVIEPDGDRLPDGAWEELEKRYLNAVEEIASVWGPPDFNGSWTDPGFSEVASLGRAARVLAPGCHGRIHRVRPTG